MENVSLGGENCQSGGVIELVALDMAGTTIDDNGVVYQALYLAVEGTGARCSTSDVEDWMGIDKRVALRALAELGGVDLDEERVEKAYASFREILAQRYQARPPRPIAGVERSFETLQSGGVKVALTTGFAHDVAGPLLKAIGWAAGEGAIDAIVCVDDVAAGRPAPDLIYEAMSRTGVTEATAVVAAGDTVADLRAARNAGAIAVGVGTGKLGLDGLRDEPHDYLLDSVADLPSLVARLSGR